MQIIWLSKYKTFTLSGSSSISVITGVLGGVAVLGFLIGLFFHSYGSLGNFSSTKGDPQQSPEQQVKALSSILADLEAKISRLEILQKEVSSEMNTGRPTKDLNADSEKKNKKGNKSTSSSSDNSLLPQGGRLVLLESDQHIENRLLLEKLSAPELIERGEAALKNTQDLEDQWLSVRFALMTRNVEQQFIPNAIPTNGNLTSLFGPRTDPFTHERAFHEGIDFAAPSGTPVYAAATGQISKASYNNSYGNQIAIEHTNGITTTYSHLSRMVVQEGQRIQKGQLIGYIGTTGRSTGDHLHYEIHKNGVAIDPRKFLNQLTFYASDLQ